MSLIANISPLNTNSKTLCLNLRKNCVMSSYCTFYVVTLLYIISIIRTVAFILPKNLSRCFC